MPTRPAVPPVYTAALTRSSGWGALLFGAMFWWAGSPLRALISVLTGLTYLGIGHAMHRIVAAQPTDRRMPVADHTGATGPPVLALTRLRLAFVVTLVVHMWALQATDPHSLLWVVAVPAGTSFFTLLPHAERRRAVVANLAMGLLAVLTVAGALDGLGVLLGQPPLPAWVDLAFVISVTISNPIMRMRHEADLFRHRKAAQEALETVEQELIARTRLAADLDEAKERAQASSAAKSAFLANMSHEIRTPLGAVISLTELALETDDDAVREEHLRLVHGSATHLLTVLNDVLDLSKIEAGHLSLERVPADLPGAIEEVVALARVRAEERGLAFALDVSLRPPATRLLDALRLKQVLHNLIGNAVKFTERGQVRLEVTESDAGVRFAVHDTGIGMTPDQVARIFEPFHQAEASTARRFGGTGLGLSICQRLLGLWDSALTVEARPGAGTTFAFILDLPPAAPSLAPEAAAALELHTLQGLRVLVAEDNAINQHIIRTLLAALGVEPTVVGNGQAALDRWDEGWDLLLMDVQMPEMDGHEATRQIRAAARRQGGPGPWIVALTANAMDSDREACREAGMDDVLTKPVCRDELARAILARRPAPARARSSAG